MFYYKCEKCQSEWNGIKVLDICPFCETKVAIQNSNFTKIDEALSYIFSEYRIDVVKENNRLVSLLSDYAPTLERERKLIRVALSLGIYSDLITVSKSDKSTQELAVNKAVSKLHNDAFMDPVIAKEIIEWFTKQLDWQNEVSIQEKSIGTAEIKVITNDSTQNTLSNSRSDHCVGAIIKFGKYPFEFNGRVKPIEWKIMQIKHNKALLWSLYCIDACQFAAQSLNGSWEYSALRKWIRETFISVAFTTEEIDAILPTTLDVSYNTKSKRNSGLKTTDKIFIPSIEEIINLKASADDLMVEATPYAEFKGVLTDDYAFWWLRTPGGSEGMEMFVSKTGAVNESGSAVYLKNRGIRPALWVDLDKIK